MFLAISKVVKSSDSLPWWVSAIYKVGVPTAIACYLVWFLTQRVQTDLDAATQQLNNMQTLMAAHVTTQEQSLKVSQEILKAMRKICVNTSDTKADRDECVQ